MSDTDTLDDPFPEVSNELETVETEAPDSSATDPVHTDTSDSPQDDATPRDTNGRFTTRQPKDETAPSTDPLASATAEAPSKPEGEAIESPAPTWQPFTIKADRETIALNETLGAQFFIDGGHAMLAVPEANLPRLQQMIGRGIVAEKQRREFDAQRTQFEAERSKPRPPSDNEIEALTLLEYLKPHLPQILGESDMQWLADKVALNQLKAQTESRTKAEQWERERTETGQLDGFQSEQLALWLEALAEEPAYAGIPSQQLKDLYEELNDLKGALFVQQKQDGPLAERYGIREDKLRARMAKLATAAKTQAESERKRKEAEERNKKLNAAPTNKLPPAPGKKGGATPAKPGKDVSKMTFAEYRDYVNSAQFDRDNEF